MERAQTDARDKWKSKIDCKTASPAHSHAWHLAACLLTHVVRKLVRKAAGQVAVRPPLLLDYMHTRVYLFRRGGEVCIAATGTARPFHPLLQRCCASAPAAAAEAASCCRAGTSPTGGHSRGGRAVASRAVVARGRTLCGHARSDTAHQDSTLAPTILLHAICIIILKSFTHFKLYFNTHLILYFCSSLDIYIVRRTASSTGP